MGSSEVTPPASTAAGKIRVLSFCRPYLIADFRANLAPVAEEFEIDYLTDGHAPGTRDTRQRFYANLADGSQCEELDAATQVEVMARCRLLRNVPADTARGLMHAMARVLVEELDRFAPDVVLCTMVDEYVTHMLAILAARRGVLFVGYAQSYFPGLIQIMQHAHGRPLHVREIDDAEVGSVLEAIGQRVFRQNYQQRNSYTLARHLWRLVRYRIKVVVFALKALLERDRWNLHYSITPYIVERRRLSDFPRAGDFSTDWAGDLQRLRERTGKPVVYLPLAYFPESTLDYWIPDTRILRYEPLTIEMVRLLAREYVVVVKEHLHMMGARDAAFGGMLRAIPGVVSVHPLEYSNDVLATADAVVLGAGSVGVEATIRDKPVLSYCETSYWFEASGATSLSLGELDCWSQRIAQTLRGHRPLDAQAKRRFIRECLASTVRSRAGGRRWPLIDVDDLRRLLRSAAGMRGASRSSGAESSFHDATAGR